ncbi:unnamed protein product [Phytophthora fragariaefolia]|uniref:Unnamed protein product n=1 Tax=Phytophthora fragariaefolia TaxID=1490495 RepID=A0A9W6XHL5_9STRA|nr:unnamed protein product [Phytophthora fragariaefolia]
MVRVSGSSGDSRFHRESNQDDVEIRLEPGIDALAVSGSLQTRLREEGSTEGQSTGRSSDRVNEEGLATDLDDKPLPPPQAPLWGGGSSRKKLKAAGSDAGERGGAVNIAKDQLEDVFYREKPGGIHEGRRDEDRQAQADWQRSSWPGDNSDDDEQQAGRGKDHVAPAEGSGTGSRPATTARKASEMQDVDIESVGSHHDPLDEFDPDDLSIDVPRRAAVASAETSTNAGVAAPRIRVSAISELKEFSGKDNDEDRARSWLGKVKSAFIRDQAPDSEKCLVFGDLLTGPARNWFMQLSRSTRSNWKSLLEGILIQYCGRGVSVARQYYHTRKRSDRSPLEYLHRLNVADMRAKLPIKDGSAVSTSNSSSKPWTIASWPTSAGDPDDGRQQRVGAGKPLIGNRRSCSSSLPFSSQHVQGIVECPPESAGYGRSADRQAAAGTTKRCSHCGSTKHNVLRCCKRLACQKCGRNAHPTDHRLFVCRASGELHNMGKCEMEKFYNIIRQLYHPTKHARMLPGNAEKMLS